MNAPASSLLTDWYQLTMAQAYLAHGMKDRAVFEFFVRRLPGARSFLVAAGLDQVLSYLETLHFTSGALAWLSQQREFQPEFISALAKFRFTGDVEAMPEGTVFFADEPILRIVAPIAEAQLVETRVLQLLHFETLIASKAARCVLVANAKPLVDYGLRRAHGAEAGMLSARASYLAGFEATTNVEASRAFSIPSSGTMAHSFIEAHDDESIAFEHFAESNPHHVTLLLDTYHTEHAAKALGALAPKLRDRGIALRGVRLDSGNLVEHAITVRRILDEELLHDVRIFVSGHVDEALISHVNETNAPIDGFGVGTLLSTSSDAPYLDCAYKLMEYAGRPRRKTTQGKATWPGRKQVWRVFDTGRMCADTVALEGEHGWGTPLLQPVMRAGRRLAAPPELRSIRDHARQQLAQLPDKLRWLHNHTTYPVHISPQIQELAANIDAASIDDPIPAALHATPFL